jgi:hypothetical protein
VPSAEKKEGEWMMKMRCVIAVVAIAMLASGAGHAASEFQTGGDRLVDLQNVDGGWTWPLGDGTAASSPTNTAAPIAMGLLGAYSQTNDTAQYSSAVAAGDFIADVSPPHSTGNGIFMDALSDATGDLSYANDVRTEYYDALDAGAYVRNSVTYDTEGFADFLLTARGNLATWDIGLAAVGAHRLGADTTDWVTGIEASINAMDSNDYYDVIGLAGGVWTLAELGVDFDPTAGAFASAGSTADLAAILAGYQIDNGGFTWNSNYVFANDDNETVQETAYAMLALDAFGGYDSAIQGAAGYLIDAQLISGGWENYSGSGENNEITGEALWALSTAVVPEPASISMGLLGMGLVGLVKRRKQKVA